MNWDITINEIINGSLNYKLKNIYVSDDIACADPEKCFEFCGNKAGCSNLAYPLLVMRLMPVGK